MVWHAPDALWEKRYSELCEFHRRFRHVRVPASPEYKTLDRWWRSQRERTGGLSDEQREKLRKLCPKGQGYRWFGPPMSASASRQEKPGPPPLAEAAEASLKYRFRQLLDLWKNSPPGQQSPDVRLWEQQALADPYQFKPEELAALCAASFPFYEPDAAWIGHYLELHTFIKTYGHSLVPLNANRGPLSAWISLQRINRKNGKLTPRREQALDRLNFVWEVSEVLWNERLKALARFIQTHGHMRVPDEGSDRQLATWLQSCRKRKNKRQAGRTEDSATESVGVRLGSPRRCLAKRTRGVEEIHR